MPVRIDTSGLDKLRRNLEKLSGSHQVSMGDLCDPAFMRTHTKFATWDEMAEAFGVKDAEDVNTVAFDEFIREHSDFENFDAMKEAGGADYAKRKLFE